MTGGPASIATAIRGPSAASSAKPSARSSREAWCSARAPCGSEVARDVLDHLENDGVDPADDEPVLAAERDDRGSRHATPGVISLQLGVHGKRPDPRHEVGR